MNEEKKMTTHKNLRELALAATSGEWTYEPQPPHPERVWRGIRIIADVIGDSAETQANAAFIAAANPQAVIELLDEVESLRDALKTITDLFLLPNEKSNERFERIGEMFTKDTGHLRPGKDYGMYGPRPPENLNQIYDDWYAGKIAKARKVLSNPDDAEVG